MSTATQLMLVGEHKLFRECLATSLMEVEDFEVCGQEDDLSPLLAGECEAVPDLLLLDLGSPEGPSLHQVRELRRRKPMLKVIIVGLTIDEEDVLRCIEAGASGYVLKEASIEDLVLAVEHVLDGGVAGCSTEMAQSLFRRLADLAAERRHYERVASLDLTPREIEILELIADGMSNKQIADELCLSLHTVKNHVHHILYKLNVRRRTQAVEKALRRRWLPGRGPSRPAASLAIPS